MKIYILKTDCNHVNGIGKVIGITRHIYEANLHNNKSSSNEYQEFELIE
jgi:hypothetical protein